MFPSHWTVVCWLEEVWGEHAESVLWQQAGAALGVSWEEPSCHHLQAEGRTLHRVPKGLCRMLPASPAGQRSVWKPQWLKMFVHADSVVGWEDGYSVWLWVPKGSFGAWVCHSTELCESSADSMSLLWSEAGHPVSAVPCLLCSSCACCSAELLCSAPYQDTDSSTNSAPTPFPAAVNCQAEMRVCPSPKLAGMFSPQILAALIISKVGAIYPSICPVFSRISKGRRGGMHPSVDSYSCQGCLQALAIWICPQPAQLLLQPCSQGSAPHSSAQAIPCHPPPASFLLMQIYEKLSVRREAHYAGNATTCVPKRHEGWRLWLKGDAVRWDGQVYPQLQRAHVCQAAALEPVRQECKSWLSCKVASTCSNVIFGLTFTLKRTL